MHLQQVEMAESRTVASAPVVALARPVADIVKDLANKDKTVRGAAESELTALGSSAGEDLLKALEKEGARFRKQRRQRRTCTFVGLSVLALYVSVGVVIGLSFGKWDLLSNLGSMGGLFGVLGAAVAMSPQHKSIVTIMASLDDVRSMGWLADALNSQDKTVQASAETALIRLLPRLDPFDGKLLDEEARRALDRKLIKTDSADLVQAILKAYGAIGDEHSLDAVVAVQEGRAAFTFVSTVADAARETADAIRVRAERDHQAQVLLRPAESGHESENLLRASEGAGSSDDSVLLRPADTEGTH